MLRGNLAPDGAVIKQSAATPGLLRPRRAGPRLRGLRTISQTLDDPDLDVDADDVLVLRNVGPKWRSGHAGVGATCRSRARSCESGVMDMVRISDARMSGTSYGTVVLHVAPESAVGGPLALVARGDRSGSTSTAAPVDLDRRRRRSSTGAARRGARRSRPDERGYRALYVEHVLQADEGCDLDFLRGRSPIVIDSVTYL